MMAIASKYLLRGIQISSQRHPSLFSEASKLLLRGIASQSPRTTQSTGQILTTSCFQRLLSEGALLLSDPAGSPLVRQKYSHCNTVNTQTGNRRRLGFPARGPLQRNRQSGAVSGTLPPPRGGRVPQTASNRFG